MFPYSLYSLIVIICPSEPFYFIVSKDTVDTTGAGDTFCASVLGFILENGLDNLKKSQLEQMLLFANAAASIVTTRKGAICSMPKKEEIYSLVFNSI